MGTWRTTSSKDEGFVFSNEYSLVSSLYTYVGVSVVWKWGIGRNQVDRMRELMSE